MDINDKKFYSMVGSIIQTIEKSLSSTFYGELRFEFHFREGKVYKVYDNSWGKISLDMEKLK